MEAQIVIVGAGSAGCALAYRLAEAGRDVLVIEAGGSDAGPFIRMPGALSYPMNMRRYDWGYRTEPEPGLNGRSIVAPRGRVLGGSSSINGMIWVRGHPMDYDHWAEAGAEGWAWADVAPYFKRLERWHGVDDPSGLRGRDGPVHVGRGARTNPLVHAFVEAGRQAGYAVTEDYNGARQEGVGPFDATIHRGRRWSAADAYLRPARRLGARLMRAEVRRVLFEGRRAAGVELAGGRTVRAREVVLAASAFNTPKLLMLSGVGPAGHLRDRGVEVVADRPGVGGNLQDHLEAWVQYASRAPITLARYWSLWGKAYVGARWLMGRGGPGASNQFESAGFVRSAAGVPYPDVQWHFLPLAVRYDGKASVKGHGFQAHVSPTRSKSAGTVRLRAGDPEGPPELRFNYLTHEEDRTEWLRSIALTREIFAQDAFAPYVEREVAPGPEVQGDDAVWAWCRAEVESAYHPCGTARMGRADDPLAVCDAQGRVIGTDGLRVCDSSLFPRVTNGNTNAPSILVGERIADHMLGRAPLPRDERPVWQNPAWAVAQR